jgi:hypothetical protein
MSRLASGHVSAPTKRVPRHTLCLVFSPSRSGGLLARPEGLHGGPLPDSSASQTCWRGLRSNPRVRGRAVRIVSDVCARGGQAQFLDLQSGLTR